MNPQPFPIATPSLRDPQYSVGLPDVHAGYGFAIGNMAAFDMDDPEAIVSPGGVGFDINCGVRLLRTNLDYDQVNPVKEQLAQALFDHIPVGVGAQVRRKRPEGWVFSNLSVSKNRAWCQ